MGDNYQYSGFQKFGHDLVSGKWMTAIGTRLFHRADKMVYRLSGGRYTATSLISGLPMVMVHTIGAKSGQPRPIPLLCIRENKSDTEFAIIASNFGQAHLPAWYFNLKANPQVECTIRGETKTYLATEADPDSEAYRRYWSIAEKVYVGYPKYKERAGRHIPILIMTPVEG